MKLFSYHITRNSTDACIPGGGLELWKEGANWVITTFPNDVVTNEHIRVGDWVCSVKRIVPYIFKVTFIEPLYERYVTPLDEYDF